MKCSVLVVVRAKQMKTTRYHFTPSRMVIIRITTIMKITTVVKDVEKLEPSYVAGGNVK